MAYLLEGDGTLLTGDALGIVLGEGAFTHPPTPPPAVDLDAWWATLTVLRAIGAEQAALAHFGLHQDVEVRIGLIEHALRHLEARVRQALRQGRAEEDARAFDEEVRAKLAEVLPRERADRYFDVFSAANDWRGVERYVLAEATTQKGGD